MHYNSLFSCFCFFFRVVSVLPPRSCLPFLVRWGEFLCLGFSCLVVFGFSRASSCFAFDKTSFSTWSCNLALDKINLIFELSLNYIFVSLFFEFIFHYRLKEKISTPCRFECWTSYQWCIVSIATCDL